MDNVNYPFELWLNRYTFYSSILADYVGVKKAESFVPVAVSNDIRSIRTTVSSDSEKEDSNKTAHAPVSSLVSVVSPSTPVCFESTNFKFYVLLCYFTVYADWKLKISDTFFSYSYRMFAALSQSAKPSHRHASLLACLLHLPHPSLLQ